MPSKIIQFQSMPDGSLVALDSNGSLWRGVVDTGYYTQLAGWQPTYASASTFTGAASSSIAQAQAGNTYVQGTGKLKWTKISE
jgi:hypothetical protein